MRALALALLVAASPDGGVRAYDVARANLDLVDGRSVGVDGGCWLRDDACVQAARDRLVVAAPTPPGQTAAVYGAGVLTGVVLTVLAVVALAFGGRK